MEIDSIAHKGLRRFFETGNAKGLVGDISRLRKMLAFIDAAGSLEELSVPPNYGLHPLRALLEIRYDRFSRGFECDSKAGCGRQHNEAAWPELHARRNAIRLI